MGRKHTGGEITRQATINGQEYFAPDLGFGIFGSQIRFIDKSGVIKWLEIDDGKFYICSEGYNQKELITTFSSESENAGILKKSFLATVSKTETNFQNQGYYLNAVAIKNLSASPVDFKIRQEDGIYIVGSANFYVSQPALATNSYTVFSAAQSVYDEHKDLSIIINGSSNLIAYVTLIQLF